MEFSSKCSCGCWRVSFGCLCPSSSDGASHSVIVEGAPTLQPGTFSSGRVMLEYRTKAKRVSHAIGLLNLLKFIEGYILSPSILTRQSSTQCLLRILPTYGASYVNGIFQVHVKCINNPLASQRAVPLCGFKTGLCCESGFHFKGRKSHASCTPHSSMLGNILWRCNLAGCIFLRFEVALWLVLIHTETNLHLHLTVSDQNTKAFRM